jgi:FlaA1/EpsC-like NDP-sugar epimerase
MSPHFRRNLLMKLIRDLDLAAVCITFLAALALSSGSLTWPSFVAVLAIRIKVANLLLFMGYIALCSAVFSACGLYRSHRLSSGRRRLYEMFCVAMWLTGVLLVLKWAFNLTFVTSAFLLWFWLLTWCTLWLLHELALQLLQLARVRGRNLRNVVIVGEGTEITDLANRIRQEASLGYCVLRTIDAGELVRNEQIARDR